MAKPKLKPRGLTSYKPGTIRYLTYWLIWPGERDHWVSQVTFCSPLDVFLRNTKFHKEPLKAHDLMTKGETKWKDGNGVTHMLRVEETKRNTFWGAEKKNQIRNGAV